jgi:hypothetical protein
MFSFVWTYFQVEETEKTGNLPPVYAVNALSRHGNRRRTIDIESFPEKTFLQSGSRKDTLQQ